jgi:hypothetical protein
MARSTACPMSWPLTRCRKQGLRRAAIAACALALFAGIGCTSHRLKPKPAVSELVLVLDCPRKAALFHKASGVVGKRREIGIVCELTLTNHTASTLVLDRALLYLPAELEAPGERTRLSLSVESPSSTLREESNCLVDTLGDPFPSDVGPLAPGETTTQSVWLSPCFWSFRPNTEYVISATYIPPPLPPAYRLPEGPHVIWTEPVTSNEALVWIYDQSPGVPPTRRGGRRGEARPRGAPRKPE